jgi:glycosyltransferase involved in cell wall biosynthesis
VKRAPLDLGVCMLTQGFFPRVGGAERQLQTLIPYLRDRGVAVCVVTRRYPGLTPHAVVAGAPVLRMPISGGRVLASLRYTATALLTIVRLRRRIAILHAHELLSPTTTAVMARLLIGRPVVVKVLRGGAMGDVAVLRGTRLGGLRFRLFRHLVNAFITISDEIERELVEAGVPPNRVIKIPNGVDTQRFRPPTSAERHRIRERLGLDRGPLVLFVGRLESEKGVHDLLDAWQIVRTRAPQAALWIVGDGARRDALERREEPGVRFLGSVEDPLPFLQASDCFVLPSHTEGLSNSLLEAMATGIPCVATAIGGNVDLIRPRVDGWLVQPGDSAELGSAIVEAISTAAGAVAGASARTRVVECFSITRTADQLATLYRRLAQRDSAA